MGWLLAPGTLFDWVNAGVRFNDICLHMGTTNFTIRLKCFSVYGMTVDQFSSYQIIPKYSACFVLR